MSTNFIAVLSPVQHQLIIIKKYVIWPFVLFTDPCRSYDPKKEKAPSADFFWKTRNAASWNFHQKISTLLKCALSFNPMNCTSILTILVPFLRKVSSKDVSFAYSLLKFLLYNGYNTRHVWEIAVRTRIEKWRSEYITESSFIFTFDLLNCGQTLHKLMSGQQLYVIFWQMLVKKFCLNNNKTISIHPWDLYQKIRV